VLLFGFAILHTLLCSRTRSLIMERTLRERTTRLRNRLDGILHSYSSSDERILGLVAVIKGILDIIDRYGGDE
jgi:hypothetical protein